MPPIKPTTDHEIRVLGEIRKVEADHELATQEQPAHDAVVNKAKQLLTSQGTVVKPRYNHSTTKLTPWYEKTDMAHDGKRYFYRLAEGWFAAQAPGTLDSPLRVAAIDMDMLIRHDNPVNGGALYVPYTIVRFGDVACPPKRISDHTDSNVNPAAHMFEPAPRDKSPLYLAVDSVMPDFQDLIDTLQIIEQQAAPLTDPNAP